MYIHTSSRTIIINTQKIHILYTNDKINHINANLCTYVCMRAETE